MLLASRCYNLQGSTGYVRVWKKAGTYDIDRFPSAEIVDCLTMNTTTLMIPHYFATFCYCFDVGVKIISAALNNNITLSAKADRMFSVVDYSLTQADFHTVCAVNGEKRMALMK